MSCKKFNYCGYVFSAILSLIPLASALATASDITKAHKQLLWESAASSQNLNFCRGYYRTPDFVPTNVAELDQDKLDINADTIALQAKGASTLKGHVRIHRQNEWVSADFAEVLRDRQGQWQEISVRDHVMLYQPHTLVTASRGKIFSKSRWTFEDVTYRYQMPTKVLDKAPYTAWGVAKRIRKSLTGRYRINRATYSTCEPVKPFWHLQAQNIQLDPMSGRGYAKDVTVYIHRTPVVYSPYLNFPIDERRQSGWLFPSLNTSTRSGFELAAPYYFNLAPPYDLTVTPHWMSKRGVMGEGLFRYLDRKGTGILQAAYLPRDEAFIDFKRAEARKSSVGRQIERLQDFDNERWSVQWQDQHNWTQHWQTNINFNEVSDDYYFQDFGHGFLRNVNNQLPREAEAKYTDIHWLGLARLQHFRTLHPINQPLIDEPYARLPQLVLQADYPDVHRVDYALDNEWVYFDKEHNPDTGARFTTGSRLNIIPSMAKPIETSYGYIIPRVRVPLTQYALNNPNDSFHPYPLFDRSHTVTRAVPITSIDSGLFFDRKAHLFETRYQHTLEPRLYYLFVPYRNQNDIPIFDTMLQPFDVNQLFRDNRFSGYDRMGDANQISVGITSRLFEENTGFERLRATLGQIYYFRNRKVTLCDTPGCRDDNLTIGTASETAKSSPIVGGVNYALQDKWNVGGDVSWDTERRELINRHAYFGYQSDARHIVNLGYYAYRNGELNQREQRTTLEQVNLGLYWPLSEQWSNIGHIGYNLGLHRPQLLFYGVEYSSCCWAVRAVAERSFVALNPNGRPLYENGVYLQFRLKGLGTVGVHNPTRLLQDHVPGYQDNFVSA